MRAEPTWPYCADFLLNHQELTNYIVRKKDKKCSQLDEKYDLIEMSRKNPHLTGRILAEKFECGKTQVNTILTKQESIREQYESNISSDSVLLGQRSRPCGFGDI